MFVDLNRSREMAAISTSLANGRRLITALALGTSVLALGGCESFSFASFGQSSTPSLVSTEPVPEDASAETESVDVADSVEPAIEDKVAIVETPADETQQPEKRKFSFSFFSKKAKQEEQVIPVSVSSGTSTATSTAVREALKASDDGSQIVNLVRTYDRYRQDLTIISASSLGSKSSVADAHKRLSAYDHETLAQAWVAYNAAIAAEQSDFAREINRSVNAKGDRFFATLNVQHDNILKLKSSDRAAQSVLTNVTNEAGQLREMAATFKQAAYDLQSSKEPATFNSARQYSVSDLFGSKMGGFQLISAGRSQPVFARHDLDPNARPMLGKMLTLGAHISVDQADGKYAALTERLVSNNEGKQCLKWAKLNLAQCLAASRDSSEEAFCTGRHALKEVSACWSYMTVDGGDT